MSSTTTKVYKGQLPCFNHVHFSHEKELLQTAKLLATPGKGILAADEPNEAYDVRFGPMGLANNIDTRRHYRVVLLETPGIEQYISGVILSKETVEQTCSTGENFPHMLRARGIVSGINVDGGLVPFLEGAPGEEMTAGLDVYPERAKHYFDLGCRFSKWRNAYKIQNNNISEALIQYNAETLARYAFISQYNGLVPIVEPEIMLEGIHDTNTCERIS